MANHANSELLFMQTCTECICVYTTRICSVPNMCATQIFILCIISVSSILDLQKVAIEANNLQHDGYLHLPCMGSDMAAVCSLSFFHLQKKYVTMYHTQTTNSDESGTNVKSLPI